MGDIVQNSVTLGVIAGLVIGKPLGITGFTFLAIKIFKSPLADDINRLHIFGASMPAGIGFTMSIFFTSLSFSSNELVEMSKIGIIIASLFSATAGLLILIWASSIQKSPQSAC